MTTLVAGSTWIAAEDWAQVAPGLEHHSSGPVGWHDDVGPHVYVVDYVGRARDQQVEQAGHRARQTLLPVADDDHVADASGHKRACQVVAADRLVAADERPALLDPARSHPHPVCIVDLADQLLPRG